jgi:hypothetical protein
MMRRSLESAGARQSHQPEADGHAGPRGTSPARARSGTLARLAKEAVVSRKWIIDVEKGGGISAGGILSYTARMAEILRAGAIRV